MNRSFLSSLSLVLISLFLILTGCKKDEAPTAPQNHLPKIESLTANPATVLISTEATLTCIATDEDGDNLTITWSSKRGTFSNGVVGVAVKWVAPSTAGTDTINVIVNDGKQTLQGKLEVIVGTVSANPTLIAPTNNAIEVALSPTLTWNAVSNATSYTLQVSTSNAFNSFIYNQSGLTNTNQLISSLNSNTTYYWRVNSTNFYGTSGWSNVFSFKTLASPSVPTLLSPANNAVDILLTPTLSWSALSNATSYTLQVSATNSFTSFVYNQSNLINPSQQISGLNYFAIYYWRVSATNSYGTSGWSSTWSFTAIGTAPQAPVLLTPINNAVNISITPLLSWNGSTYATSYTLQISASSSFTSFVYNQNGLTNTNQQVSGLVNSTKYYWRVGATNSYGTSQFTPIWSFTSGSWGVSCPEIPIVTYGAKTYNTVQIGNQCWLKENLDVGTMIQGNQDQSNNGTIEKFCYENKPENCSTYGGLYQWAEVVQYKNGATNSNSPNPAFTGNIQGLCPSGWHIPTKTEFSTLQTTVGGSTQGNVLKAVGMGTGSGVGTNTSGFSALLAGYHNTNNIFGGLGERTYFWSTTEGNSAYSYFLYLYFDNSGISFYTDIRGNSFSVRCLKD